MARRRMSKHEKPKKRTGLKATIIILILFIISGFSGYFYANLTKQKSEEASNSIERKKEEEKEKSEKVHSFKLKEWIRFDENIRLKVTDISYYETPNGPKTPLGITVTVENESNKKQELPPKYLFDLSANDQLFQSIGIYGLQELEAHQLSAKTAPLDKKEKREVVYLFTTKDKKALEAKEGKLTIETPEGKQEVTLKMPKLSDDKKNMMATEETSKEKVIQSSSTEESYVEESNTYETHSSQEALVQQNQQNTTNASVETPMTQKQSMNQGQPQVSPSGQKENMPVQQQPMQNNHEQNMQGNSQNQGVVNPQ